MARARSGGRVAGSPRAATAIAILAQVRTSRWLVTCIVLLGALALAVPAVTIASGGGSAGDQQYTDPFGGSSPGKSKPKTTASTTTTQAATTSTPVATSTTPVATADPTTAAASDPTTPTATIATSTAGRLPHTGYDSLLSAVLGFALVSGGLILRAQLRRG